MRQLGDRPLLGSALAAGNPTGSLAFTVADWTRKLPEPMLDETDRILLKAATAGASLDDLDDLTTCRHRGLRDRDVAGAAARPRRPLPAARLPLATPGVIRSGLTPGRATAVRAVLEAPGKKAGPEDDRTEGQRFHDALQQA